MLDMSYNVNFSWKHRYSIQSKEYLIVYGSQLTSKVGSHQLYYCEDILFHLSQFMTKFTFEQCFSFQWLFKLAKKSRGKFSCLSYKAFFIF